jgi:hypothetical protein
MDLIMYYFTANHQTAVRKYRRGLKMKKKLDMNIINQKPHKTVSTKEALKDVEPYLSDEDFEFLSQMNELKKVKS